MTTRTITKRYSAAMTVPGPQEAISMESTLVSVTTIAVFVDGMADFSVEFTLDDVNDASRTPLWLEFQEIPSGSTETLYATFGYPVEFVRINIGALTGDIEFKVLQSFNSV